MLLRCVLGAVVALNVVVDALCSLLCVQLAIVAVLVLALEVVDAVCHVGCLLYLCEEAAGADSVDATLRGGRNSRLPSRRSVRWRRR